MSITLLQLRTQARERADMVDSQFVEDAELNSYINNSLAELHDLLIGAYNEDYYMDSVSFTATSGVLEYDLPNGTNYSAAPKFYKLRGVDVQLTNGEWSTVKRFNFNRRNENADSFAFNLYGLPFIQYRLIGSKIRFNQVPDTNTTFRIWYHRKAEVLSADGDVYDDINGWAEYIIVDAAIKMLTKEESDVNVLLAQKAALIQRIQAMAQNRDANEPESVSDIYSEINDLVWLGE